MSNFTMPDVGALEAELSKHPLEVPQSDKGRYFNHTWWPAHYKEVEGPVLKAIARVNDPAFDRRVNIMRIAERVDATNGNKLATLGFSPTEITSYVTRQMNKRLRSLPIGDGACFVIRNQKLERLQLEHKAA